MSDIPNQLTDIVPSYLGMQAPVDTEGFISEPEMFKQICAAIQSIQDNTWFGGIGGSDEIKKWIVVNRNQSNPQSLQDCTIYFDIVSRTQYGTVGEIMRGGRSTTDPTDTTPASLHWYENWLIQLSGFKLRSSDQTSNDYSASDVMSVLRTAFNTSPDTGCYQSGKIRTWFSTPQIQLIQTRPLRVMDYESDSGLLEKMAMFDLDIMVEQVVLKKNPVLNTIDITTRGV